MQKDWVCVEFWNLMTQIKWFNVFKKNALRDFYVLKKPQTVYRWHVCTDQK